MAKVPVSWRAEELGLEGKSPCPLLATVQASGPKYAPARTERHQLALPSELAKARLQGRSGLVSGADAKRRPDPELTMCKFSGDPTSAPPTRWQDSPDRLAIRQQGWQATRNATNSAYQGVLNADNEDSVKLGLALERRNGCPAVSLISDSELLQLLTPQSWFFFRRSKPLHAKTQLRQRLYRSFGVVGYCRP